jgi:hypothetical protein
MSQCLNANISSGRRPVAACQGSASFKKGSCVALHDLDNLSFVCSCLGPLFIGLSSFIFSLNCRSENSTEWNSKNSRAPVTRLRVAWAVLPFSFLRKVAYAASTVYRSVLLLLLSSSSFAFFFISLIKSSTVRPFTSFSQIRAAATAWSLPQCMYSFSRFPSGQGTCLLPCYHHR